MLKFYYNTKYKYTNRSIIDITGDTNYTEKDYENIDTPDTINGHIIYELTPPETLPTYITEEYNENTTRRWFVSGITQLRTGKYQISLLRDIISENPDAWKNERAFISNGTSNNYNKYKRWDLPFTNTKINQTRLPIGMDGSKSSFFVFYTNTQHINNGVITEDNLHIASTTMNADANQAFDMEVDKQADLPNFSYVDGNTKNNWLNNGGEYRVRARNQGTFGQYYNRQIWYDQSLGTTDNLAFSKMPNQNAGANVQYWGSTPVWEAYLETSRPLRTDTSTVLRNFIIETEDTYGDRITAEQANSIKAYSNFKIRDRATGEIFRVDVTEATETFSRVMTVAETAQLARDLKHEAIHFQASDSDSVRGEFFTFRSTRTRYTFNKVVLGYASGFDFNFRANVRKLPKSAVRCVNIVDSNGITNDDIKQALMVAMVNQTNDEDTGRIIDVQYLPFSLATESTNDIKFVTENGEMYPNAKFVSEDEFSYINKLTNKLNLNDIDKECQTIKIVSPSRASQFLFRPFNNDGNMTFSTKINLQPYSSRIYIRPDTQGLLLYNWDDKDCFTMEEDCSLTKLDNNWQNYIYQNRNYNAQFDREIQGREFERGWERRVEQAQAKSDDWTARNISSQKAKTYTGNIPIVSDIAGAIGTAWKDSAYMEMAQLDREYNEALYKQSIDLSRDMFTMQLENIQSQPTIPTKISTLDNKLLDGIYLEEYNTNLTERITIEQFYEFNGSRIDDFGTFNEYWGNFVKGKIIISNNYNQPEINEVNRRLEAGIFTNYNEEVTP